MISPAGWMMMQQEPEQMEKQRDLAQRAVKTRPAKRTDRTVQLAARPPAMPTKKHSGLMKDKITINPNRSEYGNGKAEIYDLGMFDERGNLTNLLLKGEYFTIKEKIRFHDSIQAPIFTYTIKDKKGADLTGTNTMFEGAEIRPVKNGDEYEVNFRQKMTLQGGEYLLSMSCTGFEQGEHTVYHRLYDVANITVISNKNTVGVYDMESEVEAVLKPAGSGNSETGNA